MRNTKQILRMLLLLLMLSPSGLFSQVQTNKEFLSKLSKRQKVKSEKKINNIDNYIKKNNISKEKIYPDGSIGIMEDIIDGKPQYNKPLGLPSARALRVDSLWSGGGLNLNITGEGYDKIGLWESYHPYDHIEYSNRIIAGDGGSSSPTFTHSTATAGIISATGLNSSAKGIAFNSTLQVFSTINRLGEMAAEASAGMELASYSYTSHTYYGSTETLSDTIAFAAPNFLIFQAAGSSSCSGPECVMAQQKNSVSIGAVQITNPPHSSSSEIIRGNSAMGPTIDGRIKPDLVAPFYGDDICNQNQGSGYLTFVGAQTSWTTPSAAGVGVLLQQHYQQTHNQNPMRSSAIKGLLIHTAFEAGDSPGPDYIFGWGLINAKRAVNYITYDKYYDDVIDDRILSTGGIYTKSLESDGSEPIKVTICWIDPPASGGYGDDTPKLINDLDLRIYKNGTPYYPWHLDPNNPYNPANKADNDLDNVEQVYIASPEAGTYTIEVSHKGNLSNDGVLTNGTQLFSILTSGENHCLAGGIILNTDTGKLNFCKDGYWIEKNP